MVLQKEKVVLNFQSLQKFRYLYKHCMTVMLFQQPDKTTTEV